MRGFIEKAAVLLSSVSPSIDSYFNAVTNKYRLLKPSPETKRPLIRIADMRFEKKIKPDFSKTVFTAAQKHIKKNNRVMVVMNRRGYSQRSSARNAATLKSAINVISRLYFISTIIC